MDNKVIFRGWLSLGSNGETDGLLAIGHAAGRTTFLAEDIAYHFSSGEHKVSVAYFTANKELSAEELGNQIALVSIGMASAEYQMVYSEVTGYLWTDENFVVGGHDVLEELKSHVGRFLHLEITFHGEQK